MSARWFLSRLEIVEPRRPPSSPSPPVAIDDDSIREGRLSLRRNRRGSPLRILTVIVVALALIPTGIWLAAVIGEELELRRQIAARQAQAVQWEGVQLEIQARHEVRDSIVHDVIGGRITLPEAAAWFDVLRFRPDQVVSSLRAAHLGASREEVLCRDVIETVRESLELTDPEKADAVTLRLQAELQSYLASGHGIRLPAVSFSGGAATQQRLHSTGNEK
jgi:hypothetical protein